MPPSKSHIIASGAERVQSALKEHQDKLRRIIAEKYATQLASANPEGRRALQEQMRREHAEQMKRLKPTRYTLYAVQPYPAATAKRDP